MNYKLQDLIDMAQFQALQDRLNEIYSFPSSIIDNEGNILTATAWQDICTKFHRKNKECEKECIKSDRYIVSHLAEANPGVSYRCPHGLIDNATPIIIDGEYLGNFFTGQFFLEKPDLEFFKKQAVQYGFDQEAYLEAVRKVPIWTKEQLNSYLFFIKGLIEVIGSIGLKNLKAIESEKKVRESEDRLRKSEENYRLLVETANSVILTWDTTGKILFANDYCERFFGFRKDELLGRKVIGTIVPETESSGRDLVQLMQEIQRDPDRFKDNENENITKDGRRVWIRWANKAINDRDGRLTGILSVGNDITERKKIENTLRENEGRLRGITENISDTIIQSDSAGRITYINRLRPNLTYEQVMSSSVFDFVPQEQIPTVRNALAAVFERGETSHYESLGPGPSGEWNIYSVSVSPIYAGGKIISAVFVARDITESRKLEEQLMQTQKLESIGTLAGGIAHDFNNLLQGIFGYISMAKMNADNKDKMLAMLAHAEDALHQSVNLTTQLLTFSKGGKPVKKLMNLKAVIEKSAKFTLSGSRSDLLLDIAPDLWQVEADEGQITQVIQNIVLNADQSMPMGGSVLITAKNISKGSGSLPHNLAVGNYVQIAVRDSGIGVPEQYISKIFDPYFTTKEKGSGLGLATSYSIIRNHDGLIDVISTAGKGTTFFIYLPAVKAEIGVGATLEVSTTDRKGNILVMDDDALVRNIAEEMIRALDHDVVLVEHGEAAIEKYRSAMESGRPFDMVILDLTIRGGMGGREAIRRLREIDPAVRAVVSSGYSDDAVIADYKLYGFSSWLTKPYTLEILRGTLNSLLSS